MTSERNNGSRSGDAGYFAKGAACPRCSASAYRIPRRLVDLLMSVFIPLRRYRCTSMGCDWEGNLRVKGSQGASNPASRSKDQTP